METLWQDLRYGLRMLRAKPGFTIVAVLALALGIGANTAIFSVVNAVILRPLPYPEPEQLAMVWLDNRRQGIRDDITSYPNFIDWRDQNHVFQGMAGMRTAAFTLTGVGEPEQLRGASVSINFFQLMGIGPAQGRGFTPEEETPGKDQVVVIGHGLWQRRFGADPKIIGQTLTLNGRPFTVIGIMPEGFQFPARVEIWSPLAPSPQLRAARGSFWLPVVGRLKPGVTRQQAQADMDLIAQRLEQQYSQQNAGYGINVVPLHEQVVGQVRQALLVLLGAVAFVLLIACANVANLLLARAAERQKEMAIRTALGAGRRRIIGQLLIESVMLAMLGGALGLLLAKWGLDLLIAFSPSNIPRLENISLDGRVLGFTFLVSMLTGLVFGLAPALQASNPELNETLKESGRSGGVGVSGQRIRKLLVVSEIALALVLLIGAGLMIRSFWQLQKVDSGLNAENVLTVRLSLPRTKYPEGQNVSAFYQQTQERLAALPGVQAVGATSGVLLEKLANSSIFAIEGRPLEPQAQRLELPFDAVSPNYFRAMGIQLVKGRLFTEQDKPDSTQVAIINETMVRRYFPNEDPLGKRFTFGDGGSNASWITIVGIVRDTRRQGLDEPIRIESFMPHSQMAARSMELVIRTVSDPLAMTKAVRDAIWSLDKDLPVANMRTMEQVLAERTAPRRLNMMLLGLFAAVALVLAAVGLYGVMSYSVTQRTHEIGIRMALGAQPRDVLKLVVGQAVMLSLAGVGIGLAAAFALTRLMATLLFGVSATDPLTFGAIALLLTVVALVASFIPARRAAKVDPMIALRYE
jgi:putative ABC transport system permease protein